MDHTELECRLPGGAASSLPPADLWLQLRPDRDRKDAGRAACHDAAAGRQRYLCPGSRNQSCCAATNNRTESDQAQQHSPEDDQERIMERRGWLPCCEFVVAPGYFAKRRF